MPSPVSPNWALHQAVGADHRQIQKRGYVASRFILPLQHDVMQRGVRIILCLSA